MIEKNNDKKSVSYHILPTSSNLLGICFVILSFMKVTKMGLETIIDEAVSIAIILFLTSSLYSYAAIRSTTRSDRYEKIADIIFIIGLALLTLISIMIMLEIT
jgi:hypothetical protein